MISRALDSNNNLIIQNGSIRTVDEGAQVVQLVRSKLQTYLGECFLNTAAGVAWFQEIFVKPTNLANIESILKTKILTTEGVDTLTEFEMDFEGGSKRLLTVSFTAQTIYGSIIESEVTINA